MSSRVETMQKLVELAEIEFDKAVKTLAMVQSQYAQESQQLESLSSYASEYGTPAFLKNIPLSPIQLQSNAAFGGRLHEALAAQRIRVNQLAQTVERAKDQWVEKRARVKSLQELLERIKKGIQVKLDKAEQRLFDELSAQVFHQKRKGF